MNSLLKFYKKSGRAVELINKKTTFEPFLKGMSVPFKQTPGRAQYYYSETLHLIPESIYYKIRMPSKIAMSAQSKEYEDVVEKEVLKYLESKLPYNLFDPDQGLNTDLTIGQVRQMMRASEKSFKRAESGELSKMISNEKQVRDDEEAIKDKIDVMLEDLSDKIDTKAKQIFKEFSKLSIEKSKTWADLIPGLGRERLLSTIHDLENALDLDQHNEQYQDLMKRCYFLAKARADIARVQLELVNYWNEYNHVSTYDKVCHEEASLNYENASALYDYFPTDSKWKHEISPFDEVFNEINDEHMPVYKQKSSEYESVRSKKDNFYSGFIHDDVYDHHPEKLKEDMLAYLSGAIILKNHRYRYQHEQYDRYLSFLRFVPMSDEMTLETFIKKYSEALRREIELSFNEVCPQIDANYDDYGERTVNPINSAVFYYFFSAHRTRRRFAQVILSAARYPNEKIRRAYLRFFSNA
jgi:hypothetical protein